jgi:hypothetical protein
MLDALETAFGAHGVVIVCGMLFGMAVMLAAAIYLLIKRSSLTPEQRTELVTQLDSVDRVVTSVYEYMIYAAIAAMTGLAVFFYLVIRDDYWRDFLTLYGGVVYLIGMLWAIGQLYGIRRRRAGEPAKSIRSALSQLGSKIEFKIETSEPEVFSLDDAALKRAQQHVAAGGTIDEACALVIAQYPGMNRIMQGILRKAVEAALEARKK